MKASFVIFTLIWALGVALPVKGLIPYGSNIWDLMLPNEDPFRVLEQTPVLTVPKPVENLALARADWKETAHAHVISLDVPGVKKEDMKIEIEDNRVLRISGERKEEEEEGVGEKWHRAERTVGKFWRRFRMPGSADLEAIKAHLEDGVLRITVPKVAEAKRREPRVVKIAEDSTGKGEDIKASKSDLK